MFRSDLTSAQDPVHGDGHETAGRAQLARSAGHGNGHGARSALRRSPTRLDRHVVHGAAELPAGAHLLTPRRAYTHHGIYVGDGRVVHYAGLCRSLVRGPVEEVSLEEFADGQIVLVKLADVALYPAAAIVERARSRLGEDRYRIATNNCEHFCEWCLRGESRSEQVERLLAWPRQLPFCIFAWLRYGFGALCARFRAGAAMTPAKILSSAR
ncbi:MAG TPA: lecithin retinol acyltransferase family protein [Burkholderiaceae bacterium]|nr:lecithin retinol acyltransferase family protein [Burkholderiaceae bacterium]